MPTNRELLKRIQELEEENESLQEQLDEIADIVAPDDEEEASDDDLEDNDRPGED